MAVNLVGSYHVTDDVVVQGRYAFVAVSIHSRELAHAEVGLKAIAARHISETAGEHVSLAA
jgi:hypothetical protein